jgi:AcrR family transcriptional regulator
VRRSNDLRTASQTRRATVSEALVRAGRTLFSKHAIDAVAIDDIIAEAGVAKGSFYKHFPDKDALLAEVIRQLRGEIGQRVEFTNEDIEDPALRVARAMCVYLKFVADNPEDGGVLVRNGSSGETAPAGHVNQGAIDDVLAGIETGRFSVASAEASVLFILGIAYAGLGRYVGWGESAAPWLAQQLCQLTLKGLGISFAESELIAAQAAEAVLGPFSADRFR